jgi:predicted permease
MTLLTRLMSVMRWAFRRRQAERDLDAEMQTFIEMSAAAKMRAGVPAADARRLAAIELGGAEQVKERVRAGRHGAWLDEAAQDVRHARRLFARNPGFALVIVLTLALGIGANTAIFSLIDALMLRWLPVPNPHELVLVNMQLPDASGPSNTFSYAIARGLADRNDVFEAAAGFSSFPFSAGDAGSAGHLRGALVTGDYYAMLGLKPAIGRLLTREDDEPGAPLAAVISYGFWERQYQQRHDIIGESLLLNGVPVAIVGVSPRGFAGANVGTIADVTMAIAALPAIDPDAAALLQPGNFWLRVLARPARGMSVAEATARLDAAWPYMWDSLISPKWRPGRRGPFARATFQLTPGGTGWTFMRTMYTQPLMVLMAGVALVLLIACANVASLTLARASTRQREIAVRLAMGAGRGRIVRQLLIESTMLSFAGAACGLLLAWASGQFLVDAISTRQFDAVFDLRPNWHVLAFTAAAAVATGILFGLAPAIQTAAAAPSLALKEDVRMSGPHPRLLSSLVTAQVALSLLLVVGAGLFVRTLQNLQRFDPGFNREGVLLVELQGRRTAVPAQLLDEVRRMPGVTSASVSTHTPLSGSVWSEPAVPSGQPLPERDTAYFIGAGPGFFETIQTPLVAGREFTERDSRGAPAVAIINEALARRDFPDQNPLGRRLFARVRGEQKTLAIVGLAKDTSAAGLRSAPPPTVYVSYLQLSGDFPTTLTVRARGAMAQTAVALQRLLQARLPRAPLDVVPLSAQVEATLVRERLMAMLASAFGALALLLACIGLYGLLAYSVARRTRELGIRMALGAQRTHVMTMVLAGAVRPVAIGVIIGLPVAWAVSQGVRSMLFGLEPADTATVAGSILLLAMAALMAAYLPARRAARVDPMSALRHDA